MFEWFTARARKTVVFAQEEALRLGHDYLGAEHLLLGHLREEEGVAACVLSSLGITLDGAREQVENIVGHGEEGKVGQAPFAPCAKKVLELALSEAVQIRHSYIVTEHILLGLIRKPKGAATRVQSNLGVDLDGVRREVVRALGAGRARRVLKTFVGGHHGPCGGLENDQEGIPGTGGGARDPNALRVTDAERAAPQPLRLDLDYLYEAWERDDLYAPVDYGRVVECMAELSEKGVFRLLERGRGW
jgi:hypothetical protein